MKSATRYEFEDSTKMYFNELKNIRPLSPSEERALLVKYKTTNDTKARNKLIVHNLKYACKFAIAYIGKGVSYTDLVSSANDGLIESINRFNLENENKLISYSKWWMKRKINDSIEKRNKMKEEELPSDDEKHTEIYDIGDVAAMVTKDGNDNISEEKDTDFNEPDSHLISRLMTTCSDREADMINMNYGIGYNKANTFEEIGNKYGITKERSRQIIEKGIRKMRSNAVLVESKYLSSH